MNNNDEMNEYIAKEYMSTTIPAISDFIKIPNQSREFDPEWKTNGVQQKVCHYVVDWVNKQGLKNMTVEILNEQDRTPAVLIIIDEFNAKQSRNVLMYGHLDKQPPLTDKWSEGLGPYTPVIKDGKLYGRGGVDDGYAIFCCVLLVKALQKFNKSHNRLILFFETDEESGSQDLKYYLQKKIDVIGDLSLIVCLDSGAYNYERFCLTTALRGVMNFTIKCEVTEESYDSEVFSNVLPDTFRILRQALLDFENVKTGNVLDKFYVDIPEQNMKQCKDFVKELDGKVDFDMPILDGVEYMSKDPLELVLNNVWRPSLTLIGSDDLLPQLNEGGSQLRKGTALRMSLRLPPTLDTNQAKQDMIDFFENYQLEDGLKITVEEVINGNGFAAPPFKQSYLDLASKNAKNIFNKEMLFLGVGGSIPFMNEFYKVYPQAQFFISGMVGPGASIHAPDECLDIEYGMKFFQTLTGFITDLADLVEQQFIYINLFIHLYNK